MKHPIRKRMRRTFWSPSRRNKMQREYYATFHSHFGAIRFHREKAKAGIPANLQPVPRTLSSSCGTAVHFFEEDREESGTSPLAYPVTDPHGEIEQIVEVVENKYVIRYKAEE